MSEPCPFLTLIYNPSVIRIQCRTQRKCETELIEMNPSSKICQN